jgi:methyl-accepting chemotaxis protein
MLRRIITNVNSSYDSADSSDPYEIMAYLLQSDRGMRSVPFVMELTNRLIDQISNPAVRLSELCALATAYHMIENDDAARAILSEIRSSIDSLPDTFQRVAVHAEIAAISAPFAREIAEDSLDYAIEYISSIDEDQRSPVGEQIVRAIVRLNHAGVKSATIKRAMEIAKEIKDFLHYVNALIVLLRIAHITPTEQGRIVSLIEKILPQVASPYDKAQRYLAIVPLIEELEGGDRPLRILEIVQSLAKSITIPFISGLIWRRIIQRYLMLSSRRADFSLRQKAVQMASEIEDVTIRTQLLADLGIPDLHQRYTPFKKILASAKKISCDELNLHQISMLDHAVQQIKDRGEKATYYCELAVLFRNADLNAMSERMLKAALTEAGIVRPLTRRAHIFCNIALKVYATGNEKRGKEIYDLAIEAATNIRQYSLRDKVFEDLGMAMNVVQGL